MRTTKSAAPDRAPSPQRRRSREGLRAVRIWIPDVDPQVFSVEAHRQSLAAAKSPHAQDDQNFIDSIADSE
ncbi:MAG: antitoxin MazE-like protein [Bryobacteraceae bacterium]|jgi:hypothetical protein